MVLTMGNITWQPSYSVDIKIIDLQHQKLFSILNTLYDEFHSSSDHKTTMPIIEKTLFDLEDYAKYHFGEEEKYFKEFQYERARDHTAQHRFYEEKIDEFRARYLRGKTNIEDEIIKFLDNWILNHINIADKQYTQCFHNHGLY